jgi:hypothetical protein
VRSSLIARARSRRDAAQLTRPASRCCAPQEAQLRGRAASARRQGCCVVAQLLRGQAWRRGAVAFWQRLQRRGAAAGGCAGGRARGRRGVRGDGGLSARTQQAAGAAAAAFVRTISSSTSN